MGKRENELMVGTLPNVADFIREMAADKQAILAKAAQKKRQLQAFMAKEGDHHTNFNAKMIAVTPEQKQAYRVRNLQVDYQFAVRKLRQEMGLDRLHFAYKAGFSLERLETIEAGEALPTTDELLRLAEVSGRSVHIRFD
ncbi:helix-turn-helix domain-containing protein [Ligilactobacillus murinus]|uniref:helix-turn-helix domain-containing protein n=1 Tax=Ligilactobacillus murinus TaxID=1622 RepID=UPI00109433D4|nr:helix-turn-helix transcriptional regulator [Ligilactobacillus murinus]TGY51500.1 XRE family transcriptional regulator [Ligilactobacillus murinus]